MTTSGLCVEFISTEQGRLFAVTRGSGRDAKDTVLVIPPLGEEMNKTRRMVTLVTEALAARNVNSVVFDLGGTGDSSGELSEMTWTRWISNVQAAR